MITKIFNFFINILIKFLRLNKASKFSCSLIEKLDPIAIVIKDNEKFFISCPNDIVRWRAETYFTKEPETIEWINTFKAGDILFDVGANIGLYSIYAAKRGVRVIAFEPESQNFALLNKNIYLNQCDDRIMSLNLAISNNSLCDYLYLPKFQMGGAINCFAHALDENGKSFNPVFKQGIISETLDNFVSKNQYFPTHIKIDVDGLEPEILSGSEKTLKDERLKSLLIEVNEELAEHKVMLTKIQASGLKLKYKKHSPMFDNGKYSKIYNYVYSRP